MRKIIKSVTVLYRVDRILFTSKPEYLFWWVVVLAGSGLLVYSAFTNNMLFTAIALLAVIAPIAKWVSRATDYIKHKEGIE